MTVAEAARALSVSKSTIYRRIRAGTIPATKVGRRWVVGGLNLPEPEAPPVTAQPKPAPWPPDVHRRSAEREGRKPEDFRINQWPVSNVILRHPFGSPSDIALLYRCNMPADTPRDNQYVEDKSERTGYRKLPDPVGMCLSRVKFQMRDLETGSLLNEEVGLGEAGEYEAGAANRDLKDLWSRLKPGGEPVQVQVLAFPLFYFLGEDGGVKGHYFIGHRGYRAGAEVYAARTYSLALNENGELLLDGKRQGE